MTARKLWRERERGAVAIVVALCLVMLMAAAAVGIDVAKLVYERQQLRNALDAAAAAGAQMLPNNPDQAKIDAKTFFEANQPAGQAPPLTISLRCVVGYDKTTNTPDWATVVSLCGITSKVFSPSNCNTSVCSVPCVPAAGISCNTIIVTAAKDVPYTFGPAIGVPTGSTNSMTSAACRGFCGTAVPNPMDIVVMADRTPSMASTDVTQMRGGIQAMLKDMTRDQQYVAFGAIHKSVTDTSGCITAVNRGYTAASYSYVSGSTKTFTGTWVPQMFSNTYTTGNRNDGTLAVNTSDALYKAVGCLKEYADLKTYTTNSTYLSMYPSQYTSNKSIAYPQGDTANGYGTHLASALKGAARYLYGYDPNNLSSLPSRADYGKVQKVIIFETDGRPEEVFSSANLTSTNSSLNPLYLQNNYDIGSTSGETACNNLKTVANKIKALADPPLIITIGYGKVNSFTCGKTNTSTSNPLGNSGTMTVKSVLASVASNKDATTPSYADASTCADENSDGDYYFCASDGTDLASVFRTAMGSIKGHGRLMSLPGIS